MAVPFVGTPKLSGINFSKNKKEKDIRKREKMKEKRRRKKDKKRRKKAKLSIRQIRSHSVTKI